MGSGLGYLACHHIYIFILSTTMYFWLIKVLLFIHENGTLESNPLRSIQPAHVYSWRRMWPNYEDEKMIMNVNMMHVHQ